MKDLSEEMISMGAAADGSAMPLRKQKRMKSTVNGKKQSALKSKSPATARKKPSRKRIQPVEVISTPEGFGTADDGRHFHVALAEAMMGTDGMNSFPTWWPAERISAFWGKPDIAHLCRSTLGLSLNEAIACSSNSADLRQIQTIARYLGAHNPVRVPWAGSGDGVASLSHWEGVPVVVFTSDRETHILAPRMIPEAPKTGEFFSGDSADCH